MAEPAVISGKLINSGPSVIEEEPSFYVQHDATPQREIVSSKTTHNIEENKGSSMLSSVKKSFDELDRVATAILPIPQRH